LLGILIVLIGIGDLRKLFNQPPLFTLAIQWLKSFPKFSLPKATAHLTAELGELTLTGRATLSHKAGPNATLEDRVRVLESNLDILGHRADELQQQIDRVNQERNQDLRTERQIRGREIVELGRVLEIAETSGVYLSLMGLLWLAIGLIMSTASIEFSRLF